MPRVAALLGVGQVSDLMSVEGPRRFNDLLEDLDGLAPNVLSKRLRHLEDEGVIVATPYSERPPRFDYRLTASGAELAGGGSSTHQAQANWSNLSRRCRPPPGIDASASPPVRLRAPPRSMSPSARGRGQTTVPPLADLVPR